MSELIRRFGSHELVIWVRLFNGKNGGGPVGRVVEGKLAGKVVFIKEFDPKKVSVGHFLKVEITAEFNNAMHAKPYHFYTAVPETTRTRVVHPEKMEEGHSFQASHLSQAEQLFNTKLFVLRVRHESRPKVASPNRCRRIRAFTDSSGRVQVTY